MNIFVLLFSSYGTQGKCSYIALMNLFCRSAEKYTRHIFQISSYYAPLKRYCVQNIDCSQKFQQKVFCNIAPPSTPPPSLPLLF